MAASTHRKLSGASESYNERMSNWKLEFDTQKRMLENLQVKSPDERDAIKKAVRLNRKGLEFAEQGRELEAQVQFGFLEHVAEAMRNGHYEHFKKIVDDFNRSE